MLSPNAEHYAKLLALDTLTPSLRMMYLCEEYEWSSSHRHPLVEEKFTAELALLRCSNAELLREVKKFSFQTFTKYLMRFGFKDQPQYQYITVLARNAQDAIHIHRKVLHDAPYAVFSQLHTVPRQERWVFLDNATPEGCFVSDCADVFTHFDVRLDKLRTLAELLT